MIKHAKNPYAIQRVKAKWQAQTLLKRSMLISLVAHVFLVVALILGQPDFDRDPIDLGSAIEVSFVNIQDDSPEPAPLPPKNTPPPPPPPTASPVPPAVQELSEFVEFPQQAEPEPEPPPTPPKPPPPLPAPPAPKTPPKPAAPPQPSFASSLKNLQKELEETQAPPPIEDRAEKEETKPSLAELVARAAQQAPQTEPARTQPLSPTGLKDDELSRVRDQVIRCWNPPVGARDANLMRVVIEAQISPDKQVLFAKIADRSNETSAAFAESALRAVLVCKKLDLPDGKYAIWNRLNLVFTPQDIQ
ncbi:MAG: hypothetical protein AB8B77_07950 [Alphaproteobacteria bacterium]